MSKKPRHSGPGSKPQDPRRLRAGSRAELEKAERFLASGRPQEALTVCRQAMATATEDAALRAVAGLALHRLGRPDEARKELRLALDAEPGLIPAALALFSLEAATGRTTEAESVLDSAGSAVASDSSAAMALADAAIAAGMVSAAERLLSKAVILIPKDAQLRFKHALTLQMLHRGDEAVKGFRAVLALQPGVGAAHANIGAILAEAGRYEEARNQYALAARAGGPSRSGYLFRRALLSPPVFSSETEITEVRARIEGEVRALREQGFKLTDPPHEVGTANFYLTYQGLPDKVLQTEIARAYLEACPGLGWESPNLTKPRTGKLRVGFCSAFFRDHTVGRVFEGVIRGLSRLDFEVVTLSTAPPRDEMARRIARSAGRHVVLPPDLKSARQAVADERLDVLVYADIGMDTFTYFLSFARLAPVQCAGWGHPDTTGVPHVDYYLSAETFEPEGADDHYSERLVQFPRIACDLARPSLSVAPVTKADLGFSESERVYLCAQSLFKFHPGFDPAVAEILRRDPSGRVVFFETSEPNWVKVLKNRLAGSAPDVADRVSFLPRLDPTRFLGALKAADAVIDTRHFTGGHTAYLAFAAGVPVVTWNGGLMRGRMTSGLYRQMGLDGMVADDEAGFADRAVALAQDRGYREDWRERVRSASPSLFDDHGSVDFFADFLRNTEP